MRQSARNQAIQHAVDSIARTFDPEKIILFGSSAWGNPGPDSDADLLIIHETDDTRKFARAVDAAVFPRMIPIDILVYRPGEIERRKSLHDGFIMKILSQGKVLHERIAA